MNNLKKIFIFIFTLILSISLFACGKDKTPDDKKDPEIDWSSKRVYEISAIEEYQEQNNFR